MAALCAGLAVTVGGGVACLGDSAAFAAAPLAAIAVSPALPSTADSIALSVTGDPSQCWPAVLDWDPPLLQGSTVVLQAHTPPGPLPPSCTYPWPQRFTIGPLPAGAYSVEFHLDQQLLGAQAFDVTTPTTELALVGGRFRAVARFTGAATATELSATAVQIGDDAGYFWFFSSDNVELTIKVLDGRGVNGHFWVFIASMTDVANRVDVTDTTIRCVAAPCATRTYTAPAGQNMNFIDTQAF